MAACFDSHAARKRRKALKSLARCEELWRTIRAIVTKSGGDGDDLDPDGLKMVKKLCRNSDARVEDAFNCLLYNLNEWHAEVRLLSLSLLEYLFRRSAKCRHLLLASLDEFFFLCMGARGSAADLGGAGAGAVAGSTSAPGEPAFGGFGGGGSLPPPKRRAEQLVRRAAAFFLAWRDGAEANCDLRAELDVAHRYLARCPTLGFASMEAQIRREQEEASEDRRRAEAVKRRRVEQISEELGETGEDIESCVRQLNGCLELLVPSLDKFGGWEGEKEGEGVAGGGVWDLANLGRSALLRQHGIVAACDRDVVVTVTMSPADAIVVRGDDNAAVVDGARDQCRLLVRRWLPRLIRWQEAVGRFGGAALEDVELARRVRHLKLSAEEAIKKYNELELPCVLARRQVVGSQAAGDIFADDQDDGSGSESDGWESEPEKEGYEEYAVATPVPAPTPASVPPVDIYAPGPSGYVRGRGGGGGASGRTDSRRNRSELGVGGSPESGNEKDLTTWRGQMFANFGRARETVLKNGNAGSSGGKEADKELVARTAQDVSALSMGLSNSLPSRLPTAAVVVAPSSSAVAVEAHRFWAAPIDLSCEEEAALARHRADVVGAGSGLGLRIQFAGEFLPVKHTCKVPLPSGRLCPRQDRVRCPLHGVIVPRDDKGTLLDPELGLAPSQQHDWRGSGGGGGGGRRLGDGAEEEVEPSPVSGTTPDWQDPELLRRLKEETGVDLKMPDRSKKRGEAGARGRSRGRGPRLGAKRTARFPNLMDISLMLKRNNSRMRLEKKIMSKAAVKRVGQRLDAQDRRRHADKYGAQWNYL